MLLRGGLSHECLQHVFLSNDRVGGARRKRTNPGSNPRSPRTSSMQLRARSPNPHRAEWLCALVQQSPQSPQDALGTRERRDASITALNSIKMIGPCRVRAHPTKTPWHCFWLSGLRPRNARGPERARHTLPDIQALNLSEGLQAATQHHVA